MLLSVENLTKIYHRRRQSLLALDRLSFQLEAGEIVAVIGESGSGKSTLARCICRFVDSDGGNIRFQGEDITQLKEKDCRLLYRKVQMVFQNPVGSFHPRQTLGKSIQAGLKNFNIKMSAEAFAHLMDEVQLPASYLDRYPHQVSGGECQRAALLRALCIDPDLLICDEVTSALDVSTQGKIAELIRNSCHRRHLACLFITHDLCLARWISDRTLVLHEGRLVEAGPTADLFSHPQKSYTKELLENMLS